MRSLAVYSHLFMYFRAVGLLDPIRCVLKHGTGHAVKCLGWLCPLSHIYFFAFRDTNGDTLVSLRPETCDVATRVSGRKWVQTTELDTVNGSFYNLCALALWLALHIFATQC